MNLMKIFLRQKPLLRNFNSIRVFNYQNRIKKSRTRKQTNHICVFPKPAAATNSTILDGIP